MSPENPSLIEFDSIQVDLPVRYPSQTKAWILNCVAKENREITSLSYIFCDDAYLHQINKEFLNHDTYTDIITFDMSDIDHEIEAEIYISVTRVIENAELFKKPFANELHRVIIHGVLHLIGYDDKNDEQKSLMRKKEDMYLSLL